APRAAELLRLLRRRGDLSLAAVGLDHHQARALEQRPGIDFRLFTSHRLFVARDWFFVAHDRLLVSHRRRLVSDRLLAARFLGAQRLFQPLRFPPLILADRFVARLLVPRPGWRSGSGAACGRLLVPARTIAAMAPAAAAVLLAFARSAFARTAFALRRPRLLLGPGLLFRPGLLRSRLLLSLGCCSGLPWFCGRGCWCRCW